MEGRLRKAAMGLVDTSGYRTLIQRGGRDANGCIDPAIEHFSLALLGAQRFSDEAGFSGGAFLFMLSKSFCCAARSGTFMALRTSSVSRSRLYGS